MWRGNSKWFFKGNDWMINPLTTMITSGSAFTNPYKISTDTIKNLIDVNDLTNENSPFYVTSLANAFFQNPLTDFIPSKVTSIASSFETVKDQIDVLVNHSDKLSGVDITGDIGLGNMAQIMTIARAVSGESSCSTFNKAFGVITQSKTIIASILSLIDKIVDFLSDPEAIADELLNKLESVANNIISQVASDLQAYAEGALLAIANALASSISSLIDDPCFSGVIGTIATDTMKEAINNLPRPQIPSIEL